ncbi:MAG: CDP-diacylglycerol--serine O-phosphatidyltransferase [Candidatus Omnitrophota bacterium]|nr:MAG: CDP-diacylglycerol--serine O-phosphatidyltransferase [Candidatus Omnitrophota bacterium]
MESARYMANVITAANLLFGAMSIFLSVRGSYIPAAWIIFFSIIFDIADGKVARMSKEVSEFGKQFDSLADLISFVVAPSVLVFTLNCPKFFLWRLLVCLIAVFCGAFRLARFNTESEEKSLLFFNGLPTPGFGALVASIVLIYYKYNLHIEPRIVSVIVAILAMMMVSGIKYPTFKNVSLFQWKYLLSFVIILAMLFIIPELVAFVLSLAYVVLMPIKANLMKEVK